MKKLWNNLKTIFAILFILLIVFVGILQIIYPEDKSKSKFIDPFSYLSKEYAKKLIPIVVSDTTERDLTKHENFIYWSKETNLKSVEKDLKLKCGAQWFNIRFNRSEFDGSVGGGKVVELNKKTIKINRNNEKKANVEIYRFDNYYVKDFKETYTFYIVAHNYQNSFHYYQCVKDSLY